jgi:hypothetical protein
MSHREAPSCNGSQQESQKLTGDAAGETTTPRTDAFSNVIAAQGTAKPAWYEFARQLERETSELKAQLKLAHQSFSDLEWTIAELKAQIEGFRKEMPSILFDGPTVYANLTDRELGRTSTTNVSDVLNAIVRALRKERAAIDSALHHDREGK